MFIFRFNYFELFKFWLGLIRVSLGTLFRGFYRNWEFCVLFFSCIRGFRGVGCENGVLNSIFFR